ncbi:MAG: VWA domain-containing protein [Candidatus Sulfotelmatobacter sp.]
MRKSRLSLLLLSLFMVSTLYAQSADPKGYPIGFEESQRVTYRRAVSEVRLVFFATDEHSQNVQELGKDDFAIVDDEQVIRKFRSLTRSISMNLDVIMLIDSSESVLSGFQEERAVVAKLISHSPWSPGDRLSVLTFGGMETHVICDEDCSDSFAADRLVPQGGATPLLDALKVATTMLMKRKQTDVWPVILLFSDGDDTISEATFSQLRETILNDDTRIYAIDVSNSRQPSNGAATMQRLAAESGGRYFLLNEGPAKIFNDVIDDLRSARLVIYQLPSSSSDFHSTRILPTHNLKLHFRCRQGYYYRADSRNPEENP